MTDSTLARSRVMSGLPTPPEGWLLGVDTSRAQGLLDVPALVAGGVTFLVAKATDGLAGVDEQWHATAAAARAAGIPWGAYGVLEPRADAVLQAAHFVETVRDSGATFFCLDFELARGETGLAALEAALAWCEAVEKALGCRVILYTAPAFLEELERLAGELAAPILEELKKRRLWVAHYTQDYGRLPRVPPPWPKDGWTFWQGSGGSKVSRNFATLPGSHVEVDVDLFRGTVEELLALAA